MFTDLQLYCFIMIIINLFFGINKICNEMILLKICEICQNCELTQKNEIMITFIFAFIFFICFTYFSLSIDFNENKNNLFNQIFGTKILTFIVSLNFLFILFHQQLFNLLYI